MTDIILKWSALARQRIAPRTTEDLTSRRNYWHCGTWTEVAAAIAAMSSAQAQDPDLAAALERVRAWKEPPPRDGDPLDLAVFVALMTPERVGEWAMSHFGAAPIVPLLARPTMSPAWTSGAYQLERKKLPANATTLRRLLVRVDEEGRKSARAALQPIWDEGDVESHQELAYAFFFDDDLRKQALAEIFEQAPTFSSMQLTLARDEESVRKLLARHQKGQPLEYTELVASLGTGALPILLELAPAVRGTDPHVSHALAMTVLVCEESARHLATTISHPSTRDVISEFFVKHPALAKTALPTAAAGASRNAALAKALLLKIAGPAKEEAAEPLVSLADPAVPQILRDAPWLDPKPALPDLGIDVDAWPTSVAVPAAREANALDWFGKQQGSLPIMTDDEVHAFLVEHGKAPLPGILHEGKCIPLETVLERFNVGKGTYEMILPLLAKFGTRALPGFRQMSTSFRWLAYDIIAGIDDPHIALPLFVQETPYWWWHLAHPRSAAVGFLAAAHREPQAAIALRRLARAGHEGVILEVAEKTKDPNAVRALVTRDPRLDAIRVPAQTSTHGCSRPHLKDGRPLGDDVIKRILEMISMPFTEDSYAGVEDVRRACDPRSLAEMAWDLATVADGGGVRRAQSRFGGWMRWSLRHFADDEVIRRMTPALKHPTIYRVLETLACEGDRAALIELATAQEREDVSGGLERVAAAKQTTADELVETMLPTTELAPEGTTTLVYGAATLRVGFDTTLSPFLFAGDKRLASLPRAKTSDDPIAIRLAKERWDELKEDVRAIAHLRVHALESAMRSARKIPASQFIAGWATHPLGKHQARGVVWAVMRGEELVTFRVAEDSTFADIDDAVLVLSPGEFVRVPHPAELPPDVVNRWATILSDYGLLQPVTQLGRTPLAITPEELEAREIIRKPTTPIDYTAYRRVSKQHRHQGARPLTRCEGEVHLEPHTTWSSGKSWISQYKLCFTVKNVAVPLSSVDPVERAESLYTLRAFLEAE